MSPEPAAAADLLRLGVVAGPHRGVDEALARVKLLDHHVHSVVRGPIGPTAFRAMLTESDRLGAAEAGGPETQLAIALRRWCAPLIGLPAHAPLERYLEARCSSDGREVASRFLRAAGFERLLVDTGYRGDTLLDLPALAGLAAVPVDPVTRLETLAEEVATSGVTAAGFADAFRSALSAAKSESAGFKSIVAYRFGLDFDPTRPSDPDVAARAGPWLRDVERTRVVRLTDPVLLRFILWEGASTGKPLQVHTGYGDTDLDLNRSDPLLLMAFLRATERTCPVLLLHTYPFQRHAGYLAQMFPHVYFDVGLAINHTGAQSPQVIAESLEVAPFAKLLFSSDAWGLAELHLLGSWLFRRGLSRVLGRWVAAGDWSQEDAVRVIEAIAAGNARRVYGLAGAQPLG